MSEGEGTTQGERVIAIRPGAVGDVLLALPALSWLRRTRPDCRVLLVAREDVLPLAVATGLADETSPYGSPSWAALFTDQPDESSPARAMVAGAAAVAWMRDENGLVARSLWALGARRVVAWGRPEPDVAQLARMWESARSGREPGERIHTAFLLAQGLEALGVAPPRDVDELARAMPPLVAPQGDHVLAEEFVHALGLAEAIGPVIALHAGSGGAAKRWPPASFGTLAASIRALGATPLFVEGPQDAEVTRAALSALAALTETCPPGSAETVSVARGLSVATLAALLARCAVYVGNDSGVTHLAALAGTPTLALFGPSDPGQWRPLGRRVRVLRSPSGDMHDLAVQHVLMALRALLAETASGQEESTSLLPAR